MNKPFLSGPLRLPTHWLASLLLAVLLLATAGLGRASAQRGALAMPQMRTDPASNITATSALLRGEAQATTPGGTAAGVPDERGLVYSSTNQTPTISDTKVQLGSGYGAFSQTVTGLTAGTTYYVRAYGGSLATVYGSVVSFTTPAAATAAPVVSAPVNGSVTNDDTPTYSGTAVAGSTVTVYVNGTYVNGTYTATTTASSGGTWSITQAAGLGTGSQNTVYARAQSPGESQSANSNTNSFAVDFVAPTTTISSSTAPSGNTSSASPFAFTVTFSESVTGFTSSGVSVSNGTLTNFVPVAGGSTYTFNVTPTAPGAVTVNVFSSRAQDAAGNNNTAASQYSITYQPITAAPVILVPTNGSSVTTTTPTYAGTAPVGSTVRVYVDGVVLTNTATANSAGNWAISQPSSLSQGAHTVYATAQGTGATVSANSATNTFTVDSVRPTVVISSPTGTNGSMTSTSPFAFTVTFSEAMTGFISSDVTVSNGTLSGFAGSGSSYTFNVTPTTAGTATTVNIAANRAQDAAGNGNIAAAQYSLTYSQQQSFAPGVTLPSNGSFTGTTTPQYSGSAQIASTIRVYVDGVLLANTATTDAGGGWRLTQPTALAQGSHTVYATAQRTGETVSPNSNTNTFTVDTESPTVTLTSPTGTNGGTTSTTPFAFTATFSEAVTGLAASGITVTNGTVSNLAGSGTTYTFNVTPTTGGTATTVNIAADAAQDAAGNGNTASASYSLTQNVTSVVWNGSTSQSWTLAANWTPAVVPTVFIDATIPASAPFTPLISSSSVAARNLTIDLGAPMSQSGGTLNLNGNLINNGTFTATGGTVVLGGSTLSQVLGSSSTRFWNLTIPANGAALGTSDGASIQRVLTLNGNFATNGNPLTLESNATYTAMIVNNGTNVVTGDVTVQRYIYPDLNPNAGYRHVSSPISNATVASLTTAGFAPVVNPAYNTAARPDLVTPFPTVYGYDQARLATSPATSLSDFDKGWYSPAALSTPLTVGQGYTVNLAANQTWNFVGTPNNGDMTLTLGRNNASAADTEGLSLVGNPYPSPLDLSRVASTDRSGLDGVVYVFKSTDPTNPYTGTYGSYSNGVGNISPILPLGQAFFMRVSAGQASGTLLLKNSQRPTTYSNTAYLRTTADPRPLVQLDLEGAGQADPVYVYFEAGATAGLDSEFDAVKMPNTTGLNVSAAAGTQRLAINGLPALGTAPVTVPLAVGVPAAGSYAFNAAQLLNLATTPVYLRDRQTGAVVDLRAQPRYAFTVSNAAALITARFELVFSAQGVLATAPAALAAQVALYPNPATATASVELPAALGRVAVAAELTDALGRPVRTLTLPAQGAAAHRLALAGLAPGVYTLHLRTSAGVIAKKLVVQ